MANATKELQKAFSLKEKNENLLSNLENLKNSGNVTEEQYNSIKMGYIKTITEAKTAIEQIKVTISHNIQTEQQSAQMLDMELKNISVRFQTGEMKIEETQKSQDRIRKKIQQSNDKIAELKRLFNATNSSEVGGFIDTKPGTSFQSGSSSGFSMHNSGNLISTIKGTSASDFTEIRTDISEITGSTDHLIGLIGGIILFISLFLPWVSFLGIGASFMNAPGILPLIGLILGFAGIGAAFLARDNARGTLQLFSGIGALILIAYSLFGNFGMSSFMFDISILNYVGIGFYLFIIGAIILMVSGIRVLRNG